MAKKVAAEAAEGWTVYGVARGYREAATTAAERTGISVGAWLCRAIDQALQLERDHPIGALPPGPVTPITQAGARLTATERAIAAAVELANSPDVPAGFRRQANRLLRESLPGPVPRGPGRWKPSSEK